MYLYSNNFFGRITGISIRRITVESTSKILHVIARDGVCRNLLSGDVISDAVYTSDFSSGLNGWSIDSGLDSLDYGISLGDKTDVLRGTSNGLNQAHSFRKLTAVTVGKKYEWRGWYYIPSANTTLKTIRLYDGSAALISPLLSETDRWIPFAYQWTAAYNNIRVYGCTDAGIVTYTGTAGDVFYMADIELYEVVPTVTNTDIEIVKDGNIMTPRFNGSSSKIITNIDAFFPKYSFTVMSWFKLPKYLSGAIEHAIFGNDSTDLFVRVMSSSQISTQIYDGSLILNKTFIGLDNLIGSYKHVVYQFNHELNKAELFIDGVSQGTITGSFGTHIVDGLTIGDRDQAGSTFWGVIPETILIDGLLTPAEISQHYTSTKALYSK